MEVIVHYNVQRSSSYTLKIKFRDTFIASMQLLCSTLNYESKSNFSSHLLASHASFKSQINKCILCLQKQYNQAPLGEFVPRLRGLECLQQHRGLGQGGLVAGAAGQMFSITSGESCPRVKFRGPGKGCRLQVSGDGGPRTELEYSAVKIAPPSF